VITELNRQIGILRPTLPEVDANMTIYFQRGKPSYVPHACARAHLSMVISV
jgi:hypothetical protein